VLGHVLEMKLPGGFTWSGKSHGPVAAQYLLWSGAYTVSSPIAGDLCVWQTHIGISVGGGQMVSALDEQYGTARTPIKGYGPAGEVLVYRRITASGSAAAAGQAGTTSSSGCRSSLISLPVLLAAAAWRRAWQ
jgi:hypothetical protein